MNLEIELIYKCVKIWLIQETGKEQIFQHSPGVNWTHEVFKDSSEYLQGMAENYYEFCLQNDVPHCEPDDLPF